MEKLWKIKIEKGRCFYQFYIVSTQKPVFVPETSLGKLRRSFSPLGKGYPSHLPPIFYISQEQEASVEKVQNMHGFDLKKLTSKYIILSINNPQKKSLYEISLFRRGVKRFFRKNYILAKDKKEAIEYSTVFKPTYKVKVKKAKKMDCYPIVEVTTDRIILDREIH